MSRDAAITFAWEEGAAVRRWRLPLGAIGRIEEETGRSIFATHARLRAATIVIEASLDGAFPPLDADPATSAEIALVLREGLVGGGLAVDVAAAEIAAAMGAAGLARAAIHAERVVRAALIGAPGEPLGGDPGEATEPLASPRTDV